MFKLAAQLQFLPIQVSLSSSDSFSRTLAIGFCEDTAPLGRMIGWSEGSWGYHGDDGAVYQEGAYRFLDRYGHGENEVIGCGINFEKKIAFFTRNGKELGKSPYDPCIDYVCPSSLRWPHRNTIHQRGRQTLSCR